MEQGDDELPDLLAANLRDSYELLEDGDLIEQDEDWQNQPELVAESSERRRELEAW